MVVKPTTADLPADWRSPSRRLMTMRRYEILAVGFVGVVIVAVAAARAGSGLAAGIGLAAVVVLAVAAERFVHRRFAAWGYAEREDDLLVRRGVMFKRLSVVPYGRMQFVDVTAGPIERAFGLMTVRMHTAAAASDARIPGLVPDDATRLRDQLARLGEAKAAGL
jgi:membrane protein YdbS with pleckstrin-like domain